MRRFVVYAEAIVLGALIAIGTVQSVMGTTAALVDFIR
jgi:hypothetical protein